MSFKIERLEPISEWIARWVLSVAGADDVAIKEMTPTATLVSQGKERSDEIATEPLNVAIWGSNVRYGRLFELAWPERDAHGGYIYECQDGFFYRHPTETFGQLRGEDQLEECTRQLAKFKKKRELEEKAISFWRYRYFWLALAVLVGWFLYRA